MGITSSIATQILQTQAQSNQLFSQKIHKLYDESQQLNPSLISKKLQSSLKSFLINLQKLQLELSDQQEEFLQNNNKILSNDDEKILMLKTQKQTIIQNQKYQNSNQVSFSLQNLSATIMSKASQSLLNLIQNLNKKEIQFQPQNKDKKIDIKNIKDQQKQIQNKHVDKFQNNLIHIKKKIDLKKQIGQHIQKQKSNQNKNVNNEKFGKNSKRQSEQKNLKFYQNKLNSFQREENMNQKIDIIQEKAISKGNIQIKVISSFKNKSTKLGKSKVQEKIKQKSKLVNKYQILIRNDHNPQMVKKNIEIKRKQAEQKIISNIQFLKKIKSSSQKKQISKEWINSIKEDYFHQFKDQKKSKIIGSGFSQVIVRKQTLPSGSLILPQIRTPEIQPTKWQLNKPIAFNLYNVNSKVNQMFYNIK